MKTIFTILVSLSSLLGSINISAQLVFKTSSQTLDVNGYDYSIADMNNDSIHDIYISAHFGGMSSGHPGYIWMNNGDGSFTSKQTIGHPGVTHRVAFADLDRDGDLDLFMANDASYPDVAGSDPAYNSGCPNEVWFNDGKGVFTNSGQLLGHEPSSRAILADVDSDGDIDAIVSNYHTGTDFTKYKPDEIWLNDGKGKFTLSQTLGYGMGGAVLGDLNKDGNIDILDKDTIWFNDGIGKFTKSSITIKVANRPVLIFGDLDNDGDMDAFIGNWDTPAQVWLNDGKGNFSDSKQRLGNMECTNLQLIDIDHDGDADAFIDNYGSPCKLWINQGGKQNGQIGTFIDSGLTLPVGKGILCDFNNDGKQDAIIGNKIWLNEFMETSVQSIDNHNKISIFPNPTTGQFAISFGTIPINQATAKIYNIDGRLVFSQSFRNNTQSTIDLSGNPAGIYFIKIIVDGGMYFAKASVNYCK